MRPIEARSAKTPMGLVRRRTLRKRRSMALVVLSFLRSSRGSVSPARQQLVAALAQAGGGFGVIVLPVIGEAAGGGAGLAQLRGGRVRYPRMGGLVQPPASPRAHRQYSSRRSRGAL